MPSSTIEYFSQRAVGMVIATMAATSPRPHEHQLALEVEERRAHLAVGHADRRGGHHHQADQQQAATVPITGSIASRRGRPVEREY